MNSYRKVFLQICKLSIFGIGLDLTLLRLGFSLPSTLFWILAVITISMILITVIKDPEFKVKDTLLLIVVFIWLVKSVYIPRSSVPFFGSDSFLAMEATRKLLTTGWFAEPPWSKYFDIRYANQVNYPFVPGISIAITKLSGLSLELWARWGAITLSLLSVILVYEMVRYKYRSQKSAILSTLGFATTYYFITFHSQFVYESFAFILFLATIYAIERSNTDAKAIWRIIAIITTIAIVFTHHLTSLMLLLFLLLNNLTSTKFSIVRLVKQNNWTFIGFTVVVILTYWIYLKYTPIQIAALLIEDAFRESSIIPQNLLNYIPTNRQKISLLFQAISAIGFGILALHSTTQEIRCGNETISQWKINSTIWGLILGLITFLGIFGAFGKLSSFPSRMEIFGYAFLIPVAANAEIYSGRYRKNLEIFVVFIFLMHSLSTMFRMAPYLYSDVKPDLAAGEVRAQWSEVEYNLINRVSPKAQGIYGYAFRRLGNIYQPQSFYIEDPESRKNLLLNHFDYLLLGEADKFLQPPFDNKFITTSTLNKIYDGGDVELFVPRLNSNWSIDGLINNPTDLGHSSVDHTARFEIWSSIVCVLELMIISRIIYSALRYMLIKTHGFNNSWEENDLSIMSIVVCLLFLFLVFILFDFFGQQIYLLYLPILIASILLFVLFIRSGLKREETGTTISSPWAVSSFILVTLIMGSFFQWITRPGILEHYTEFYLYETSLNPNNQNMENIVVISNQEERYINYGVEVWIDDDLYSMTNIGIQPGNIQTLTIQIQIPNNSTNEKAHLIFNLQKDGIAASNQTLELQLDTHQ